ncbi:MAG TPA: acyl-CoA desaturase [Planctomycetota bacterium]|nr:acyl-CoA desaturase [Planctomycetota bacterium]
MSDEQMLGEGPPRRPEPAGAEPVRLEFAGDNAFELELRRRVDEYFRTTGRRPRDCWQMYLKSAVILVAFAASYVLLVFAASTLWQGLSLAVALGICTAGIGFNIQHDGGHKAYSAHPWVNKLAAMTMDLIGASSYVWHRKHVVIHHRYVNITGYDTDIDLGGIGRLSPHKRRLWFHRWQHLYLWPLYGLLAVKLQLVTDFKIIFSGQLGPHRFPRPKGLDLALFLGGKAVFLALAFGMPLLFHPVWVVAFYYGVVVLVLGILLSVVFQLPHCVAESEFPLPRDGRIETPWAVHQARVALDFSKRNPVATWALGGLNYHCEHHLLPIVCHINYPALSKVVEETCRDFGVKYREHRSFWAGVAAHYRWLREMGRPGPADDRTPASSGGGS